MSPHNSRHCLRIVLTLLIALTLWPTGARAEAEGDQRQAAAAAYDRGTAAYLQDDYGRAARWFETAHRLAPAAPALIQAVRAHHKADDMPRALTLALQLRDEYPGDERAAALASELLDAHENAFTRVQVTCEGCQVDLDGKLQSGTVFFLEPETEHEVSAIFETGERAQQISGGAGQTLELAFTAPAATPEVIPEAGPLATETTNAVQADSRGLPAWAVYIGAGVTGALLAATIASGIDAENKAEPYNRIVDALESGGCATTMPSRDDCAALYAQGQDRLQPADSAETRTNVLLVGTLAAAVGTGVIAAFFTDWHGTDSREEHARLQFGIAPQRDGMFAAVGGGF